jgi:hypothetical protein
MNRLIALVVVGLLAGVSQLAWAQQPPLLPAQEQAVQPPPPPQPPAPPVEARKQIVVTWTLGEQEWDFKDVLSVYEPVSGTLELNRGPQIPAGGVLDPHAGQAVWTFELAKDLLPGEVQLHMETEGSPFKAVLLDADRVPLETEMQIRFSRITGKKGDRVKAIFLLPPADVFKLTKTIRVERRTKIGFETPPALAP